MVSNSEIRAIARANLKGFWGISILVCFLYAVIMGVLGYIPIVGAIAALLLSGAFSYGLYSFFLQQTRGQQPELGVLFSGFQKFGATLVLYLLMAIFTALWSLLLIIPGIIAAFRYSMAYFIMIDNPGIGAMEAINQSKLMMKGYKGKLFMLYLSFIGWALLCIVTLGIGYLWLMPYMQASLAAFYEQLKSAQSYAAPNPTLSV
ncbi:DUF975 family protein [Paenibacillus thermotolerans]|uniref:DUF975 family protein n=1 Tax=Paenibacillus thermotolerans TaxID=3027807 RepID=UPI002367833B|nr:MULTISPECIES: DUF975 family protein [unclassified Paenibacillus]